MATKEQIYRAIRYGYNPVRGYMESVSITQPFPCFENSETNDSVPLNPQKWQVPWLSTFPGCRQSKHWPTVQSAVRDFFRLIKSAELGTHSQGPNDMESAYSTKEKELMETAVLCSIYMFPEGNRKRAELMSNLLLMAFLHDDIIEIYPEKRETIVDDIMANRADNFPYTNASRVSKCGVFEKLAEEVLDEDKLLGDELLRGFMIWVQHTHTYDQTNFQFDSLEEYLIYRFRDVGIEFIIGLVKFGYDAKVPISHTYVLSNFIHLWYYHICLVNDLYSFDKEKRDEAKGAIIVNAVNVLQKSRTLSVDEAKRSTCKMIWHLENQMHKECMSLEKVGILTQDQRKLIRGLLESAAGNIFYSAVQRRYGGDLAALH